MAEANGANGLDLEQLLVGVRKGKLAQPELTTFETLARSVEERLTAYKAAMENYLGYAVKGMDFTFGRRSLGQNIENALVGESGLLQAYEQLLQFGEQHPEATAGFAIFELLKAYTKYTAKLMEGFYPGSFGQGLVTGTGELEAKEAVRRGQRRELFGLLATNILDKSGVDYKLRKLLGDNFERWKALEDTIAQGAYVPPVPLAPAPTKTLPSQQAPTMTAPRPAYDPTAEHYAILYEPKEGKCTAGIQEFARALWQHAGEEEKDKYGGPGLKGFNQFVAVTSGRIAEYCQKQGATAVECTVTKGEKSMKVKIEKVG